MLALGERSVRIREVEGSNPFRSTKPKHHLSVVLYFAPCEREGPRKHSLPEPFTGRRELIVYFFSVARRRQASWTVSSSNA